MRKYSCGHPEDPLICILPLEKIRSHITGASSKSLRSRRDKNITEFMNNQIITLSKDLPIPLYHQLKTLLLEQIRTGEMKPNDRLPAEDELAATHGVSKATVRQALNELAVAGVLRREQGRRDIHRRAKAGSRAA